MRRLVLLFAAVTSLGACDRSEQTAAPPAASTAPAASIAPAPQPSASAPAPSPAAAPSRWSGTLTAKVGEVNPPKNAKEKTWKQDPGTASVGPVTVDLLVSQPRGDASGTVTGALGDLVVSGTFDGTDFRASLAPKNPNAPDAMTGFLTARVEGGVLKGEIRVSSRDGKIVREASGDLSPKTQ